MNRIVGVIPARYASTRFPGKILADIGGKPLVQWVWERACQAERLDSVRVATDDARIADVVRDFGGEVVMTRPDHPSGTDRIAEAIQHEHVTGVVNIQGDEPLIDPALIDAVAEALLVNNQWDMSTAAQSFDDETLLRAPSVLKVVCDASGRALYFSRAPIPFVREKGGVTQTEPLYWRHIGIYGYRADFLRRLVAEPPCVLEKAEKLEQLRALHMGARIKVLQTTHTALGVDEPSDVKQAERALRAAGLLSGQVE